jgi:hypothetical protein
MLASGSDDNHIRVWRLNVPDTNWQQMEHAWSRREERERKEYDEWYDLARQRRLWRASMRCVVCGKPLERWDDLFGRTLCEEHSEQEKQKTEKPKNAKPER